MAPVISRTCAAPAGCGTAKGSTNTAAFLLAASAFARASSACSLDIAVPPNPLAGFTARKERGARKAGSQQEERGRALLRCVSEPIFLFTYTYVLCTGLFLL